VHRGEDVEESVEFAPQSPWSRPPSHRPRPGPGQHRVDAPAPRAVPLVGPAPGPNHAGGNHATAPAAPPGYGPEPDPEETDHPDYGGHGVAVEPSPGAAPAGYAEIEAPLSYPVPTAEEFATRRAVRPRDWVATTGMRAIARRGTFGLLRLRPSRRERDRLIAIAAVRRNFGGLRQITVINPKGGAGKTVATLMLGYTFGRARGGFVLTWDNNETQGTLGMRAQPYLHARTVRDLLRDIDRFRGDAGRIGELAAYVRSQEDGMFDVLASDEAATAGEMLTARAFRDIRAVVGRFYKLLLVDTGNNVRAENWQAAVDASDQLVITMSARNDSAETAARLLDHLEQTGRTELVRRAVVVVTMPPHRKDVNPRPIERHFDARCRVVVRVPYDKHVDSGAPVRYAALSDESRQGWLGVAAAVADGL
jgi:MinD-like ATPase involved in chromosome partitioning or flagellar assembly